MEDEENLKAMEQVAGGPCLGSSEESSGMVDLVHAPLCVFLILVKKSRLASTWVRSDLGSLK